MDKAIRRATVVSIGQTDALALGLNAFRRKTQVTLNDGTPLDLELVSTSWVPKVGDKVNVLYNEAAPEKSEITEPLRSNTKVLKLLGWTILVVTVLLLVSMIAR